MGKIYVVYIMFGICVGIGYFRFNVSKNCGCSLIIYMMIEWGGWVGGYEDLCVYLVM